jgi:tricorn protease
VCYLYCRIVITNGFYYRQPVNINTMTTRSSLKKITCGLLLLASFRAMAQPPGSTRMLSQPAVSNAHIAFIYAEDLWVANIDGGQPRRLTVDRGVESAPQFSPDGQTICFTAQYDGNTDVFTVPTTGGVPTRLTWHPGPDAVRGFTPDGKNVLFASRRAVFTGRYWQLFTVPLSGGFPTALAIPNAFHASYAPNGQSMAYTPIPDAFRQWKHYRGGSIANIWLYQFSDHSVTPIPQPAGGCNHTGPVWMNGLVYFRSDQNGEFNIFSYNPVTKEIKQLTKYKDFPVINMNGGNGKLIFEQAGYLHLYDIANGSTKQIAITLNADLPELRSRFVKGANYVRSAGISPTGARAVFDYRGDIFTVPAEKGDARNITETPGVHETNPAWSPDGKSIAYLSDASGEYALHIKAQDGKGYAKAIPLKGTGFYAFPKWSPDSKKITLTDNGRNLYVIDVAAASSKKIASDELYAPGAFRNMMGNWSADSKWLCYTLALSTQFKKVLIYSVEQDKSFDVSDGLSNTSNPAFDPGGKYLYFLASTDSGPVVNWFDQSNNDMRSTQSIYLVTLQKETLSPFAKETDEEEIKPDAAPAAAAPAATAAKPAAPPAVFKIDTEGLQQRIIDIPVKAGFYSGLEVGEEGKILYIAGQYDVSASPVLRKYDLKKRKDSEVMELTGYVLSANGKKMLFGSRGGWGISAGGEKPEPGKGMLNMADLQVKIEPKQEWVNIFNEAWRVNRDYFYDPGMHGVDWPAMKKKYEAFLPHLSCRSDLNTVIQWLCSELAVGHHRITDPGERYYNAQFVGGGLLGADYNIANNRYQLKKVYGGLNWNPDLRSPLTEPGINAKAGEYILAINGKNLTAADNIDAYLEAKAGKITELTIGPNPDNTGSRVVKVVPIEAEDALRNRDWVEGNLKKVTEATNGQVAYVYVPNTARQGYDYFKRYFYPQANRKAIIVDERFNAGGQLADYCIDILQRPLQAYWNMRYGQDLKSPSASIQGPKVMLIDETAGSGGDMLPWMFRKFGVGTLVGKRTWGGLVGILGFPEFIDGGGVTAPNIGIWTPERFVVENEGVAPDVEVEQWPAEVIKGKDPQLEKAIELVLKQLKDNPQTTPKRPPYPQTGRQR